MFSNFRRVSTLGLNSYVNQLHSSTRAEDINFPCGKALTIDPHLSSVMGLIRNTNEAPAMQCGDELWGDKSAVCFDCFAEYDHQVNGDVESIPLRGSVEDEEAQRYVDASASESGLVRFAKSHPFITAGAAALFAFSAIGTAFGAYKASYLIASKSLQSNQTSALSSSTD